MARVSGALGTILIDCPAHGLHEAFDTEFETALCPTSL